MTRPVALGYGLIALLLSLGCGTFAQMDLPPADAGADALHRRLRELSLPIDERSSQRDGWLRRFYQRRNGQPAWTGAGSVHARADELLLALDGARRHGLDPEIYGRTQLRSAIARLRTGEGYDVAAVAAVDIGLTAAFLSLADDLRRGAVDPATASVSWGVRRPSADLSGLLQTAISLDQVGLNLQRLAPTSSDYHLLQDALVALSAGSVESADRLRANLERWRWLPREFGSQYLLVRIADFEMDYVSNGQRQTKRVIVGEPYRQTPQFASEVTHVVVHPPWYVPPRIADEELAPRLDRRLGSADLIGMQQQGFEAFTHAGARVSLDSLSWPPAAGFSSMYRLIQRPGAHNPLGRVKFDLDNPFAIYLHDTPAAGLFSRSARDLSHGCVRVDGIVDLVGQLLTTSALAGERFARLLASGETGRVDLPTPLPVYLLYWTASVTGGGEIRITADLYDVDRRLLEALQAVAGARHWLAAPIFRSASIGAESMQPITPRVATLQALIDLI